MNYDEAYATLLPLLQERFPHGVASTPEAFASALAGLIEDGWLMLDEPPALAR